MEPEHIKKPVVIDIYVDYVVRHHYIEPDVFTQIERLGVDRKLFIQKFRKEYKQSDRDDIMHFGLRYNWVFNKHLKRPAEHPTWQLFLHDLLKGYIEKYKYVIEKEAGFDLDHYVSHGD